MVNTVENNKPTIWGWFTNGLPIYKYGGFGGWFINKNGSGFTSSLKIN